MSQSACIVSEIGSSKLSNVEELFACDGAQPVRKVVEIIENIVELIPKKVSSRIATRVASELNLSRSLYQGRDRFETVQIRSQILSLLSRCYVPDVAIPFIDDILRNSQDPRSRAEAARAAGCLGPRGHKLVPALIRIITGGQLSSPVALGLFSPYCNTEVTWTTDRLQAICALGRIRTPTDECKAALKIWPLIRAPRPVDIFKKRAFRLEKLSSS